MHDGQDKSDFPPLSEQEAIASFLKRKQKQLAQQMEEQGVVSPEAVEKEIVRLAIKELGK